MRSSKELTIEEYNEEVCYCKSCHSLCVVVDDDLSTDDWDGSYCGKCSSTDIGVCKFGDWLAEDERLQAKAKKELWKK